MHGNKGLRAACAALITAAGIALGETTAAANDPLSFQPITLPENSYAQKVATDAQGNFYVGGITLGDSEAVWAAKFDSAARMLWSVSFFSCYRVEINDMTVDADGNIYAVGSSNTCGSAGPAWVAKINAAGLVWSAPFWTSASANAVAADAKGNVFVAGGASWRVGGPYKGGIDSWIMKFDPDGQRLWKHQPGTTADDYATSLATDPAGNVYLAGGTHGQLGGVKKGGQYDYDAWLIKFDADGHWLWKRQPGTGADDGASAVATDGEGNVFVVGETAGAIAGANKGGVDAWVAKFDADGHWLWKRQNGTSRDDHVYAATTDADGSIYFVGQRIGSGFPVPQDASIIKYDADGHWLWKDQPGTYAAGVAVGATGNVYVAGWGQVRMYAAADVP